VTHVNTLFRVVSVRDPIARILRTPSILRTLQIPPPTPRSANEEPGRNTSRRPPSRRAHDHRSAHDFDATGAFEVPKKVSPRSQHRFGFRSPPRLELVTSSSQPLPPNALSVRPALAFQVPIRSLSHGCSAVLRGRISRSPALRFMSLLRIYPSDPVPVIAYMSNPFILFFPLGSMSRRRRPLSSGPEVLFRASRALFRCLFILRHGPGRNSGLGI